jgi:putative ABC transport system permease protein
MDDEGSRISDQGLTMESLFQDLRYAIVTACRNTGFAAAALVTLALGIGATTAVFSIVYGVLLRPLPYRAGDRLLRLWEEHPGGVSPAGNRWLSNHTYFAWVTQARTLDGIGSYATYDYTVTFGNDAVRLFGAAVSPSVFALLDAAPARGRFFTPEEGVQGANAVVVLSDRLWHDRFGADAAILGRLVTIDETPHTIVGVARTDLRFPDDRVLFWVPNAIPQVTPDATRPFSALGRLRSGVTMAQAEAEGTAIARSVVRPAVSTELFFGKGGPVVVHARALADDITAPIRPALLVMTAAVTLILLMACANVANLFLSRGIARQRELAIRAAIGGSRRRLVRQLFTESVALSAAGGLLGVLVAWALVRVVPLLGPAQFPRLDAVRVDAGMMGIAAVASMFAAVASGLAPAVRGSRVDLAAAMRGGGDTGASGFRGPRARRLRQSVLAVEAAFAVILLVSAGLLARSFVRLLNVDAGYRADHVLSARVHVSDSAPPERMAALIERVLLRLRSTSGVTGAGAGNMMPLTRMTEITTFRIPALAGGTSVMTRSATYVVTPGYAEALGLRLREGRLFTDGDAFPGTRKMLVNEEFARQYLAGSPVGRRFSDLYGTDNNITTEIIGVVGNVLKDGNDREPQPEIYFVHGSPARRIESFVNIVVRTTGEPAALAPLLRDIVRETDATAIVEQVAPLSDLLARSVDQPRFSMMVLATFAILALTLASVGVYGVVSHALAERRRELGIRAAIGAGRLDLVRLVLHDGLSVTVAGVAMGLLVSAWLTQFMRATLFGVTPLDRVAFAAAPIVLIAVATLACVSPAFRAASIDPALALRAE